MIFKGISSYKDFVMKTKNKRIIQFGLSTGWSYYERAFENIRTEIVERTDFIVDNDEAKHDKYYDILGKQLKVCSVDSLCQQSDKVILIVVSMAYQKQICEQLSLMNISDTVECYSLPLMIYDNNGVDDSAVDLYFNTHIEQVIPKKIHCFWFSGEEKPDLYKKCIDSWKKFCPDYEIIEWNAENYDVTKNQYMYEAFQKRKWAFVSDYARLDILYEFGGVYMDMDVELVSSLTPYLMADGFFCRQSDGFLELGSGFGVTKGDELIGKMLATYKDRKLIKDNGEIDKTDQPQWLDSVLQNNGIKKNHNSESVGKYIILSNNYIVCDKGDSMKNTAKLGVHWHNGGWLDEADRWKIHESHKMRDYLISEFFGD